MSTIKGLSFEEGIKSYPINNDPDRLIHFNPGDMNLVLRYNEMIEKLKSLNIDDAAIDGETDIETTGRSLKSINTVLKEQINFLLNSKDAYDALFNGQSPLCIVGKDKNLLLEVVINALGELIGSECGKSVDALELKINKYTAKYKPQDHKKGTK